MVRNQTVQTLYHLYVHVYNNGIYQIFGTLFAAITQSAYAINSFPPIGYQPAVMITGSHVFLTERGYHAGHVTLII